MITETNTKEIYDIAGLTPLAGGYEFTFPYTSAQDVRVYTTGNKTDTEVSTSNYTIDKSGATPKVVFISGYNFPAGQTKLTIIRSVSYSQELDLRNGDLIDADKLEGALDDITQQIQQVAEKIDRAILSSVSDTAPLSIPEASQRSNMLLGFDDEGKVIPVLTTDIEQKLAQALAAEESAIIAKNAAENAQHEAESAQSAAETAQEMAETAQAAAESAETSSQAILVSISTKTEEAIASINTTKTGAVGAVTTQQATSVAAVQAAQNTAESDIAGKRASALTAIDTAKTNAVAAVNTQKETSVAAADREIVDKRDSALTDIQTARTNAVNAITTQKDTSVQEVEQLASERKAEINSLAANQKADVKQYTDGVVASAKTEIDTEKTTAVTAVQEEGDAKVAEIVSSGDAEVTRVQSVYQTDLNELKGDLVRLDGYFPVVIGANIVPPYSESGLYNTSTGEKENSTSISRTPNAIKIPSNSTELYGTLSESIVGYLCWLFYETENTDSFIRASSINSPSETFYISNIPSNANYIRLWVGNSNYDFGKLCIKTTYGGFEPYTEEVHLSNDIIIDDVVSLNLKSFPFKDKKIVNFGDSIFGSFQSPDDISTIIANKTLADVYNCGFGGCQMAKHQSTSYDAFCMYRLAYAIANNDWSIQDSAILDTSLPNYFPSHLETLKSLDFNGVDIVTISYGTNDFTSERPLDYNDDKYRITTYGGALRYSLETLLSAFPNLKVFVCTPIYRYWKNTDGTFMDDSNTHQNPSGNTLTEFVEKCKNVASEYNLPCINNYNIGIGKFTKERYFNSNDSTHPNLNGRVLIADHIVKELY